MHGPACQSTKIPIRPHLTYTEWDYTILLPYIKAERVQTTYLTEMGLSKQETTREDFKKEVSLVVSRER